VRAFTQKILTKISSLGLCFKKAFRIFLIFIVCLYAGLFSFQNKAQAYCGMCIAVDPELTAAIVETMHEIGNEFMNLWTDYQFFMAQSWMVDNFFKGAVLPALKDYTSQMSVVAMHQAMMIGTYFDAKQQLETELLHQKLQVEAHRDYQPSQSFCYFGTNVRSMAASEAMVQANTLALNSRQMKRHLGNANMGGAEEQDFDKTYRWNQFRQNYCNPKDNNGVLSEVCEGAADEDRYNVDINFTKLIDNPHTLDVSFMDSSLTPDEADVIAMGNNLYGNTVLSRQLRGSRLLGGESQKLYYALRSVAAKRNVAEHSYNSIVALKSSGSNFGGTREFLGAILREVGSSDEDINQMLGENPSYYAQLEILAKKIYQSPSFFAQLYDKPTNVARKRAALGAIELMLDRAIYESQLRQEMAMSVLLSSKLKKDFATIDAGLGGTN
jgi:uncharacterized protein YacL (UPF0231 family)